MPSGDLKISELDALNAIDVGDLIAIVPNAGGNTRQINIANLFKNIPVPVGIGIDADRDFDLAGSMRQTFGTLDLKEYDFTTNPTRVVNPIKIRLTVDGNMPVGEVSSDGSVTTGNVNILDIEGGVEAGGLIAGAKFSGMSIVIDGHADDDGSARIYAIELASNNVAGAAPKRAMRISNNWHTGIQFSSGTLTYGIDFNGSSISSDIRLSGGTLIRGGAAGIFEVQHLGTSEMRLDARGNIGSFTFHDEAIRIGRLLLSPAADSDLVLQAEVAAANIVLRPTSTGYAVFESRKTTTGDPVGVEGMWYINTFDNVVRVYADGDWRTTASW